MLVVQLLLPRFLVVEVVFFIHFVQGQACLTKSNKSSNKDEDINVISTDANQESCLVPMNNKTLIKEEPIFQDLNGNIIQPTLVNKKSAIVIPRFSPTFVSCPSARFPYFDEGENTKNVIELECTTGNALQLKESKKILPSFKDLSCSRSIRESVKETDVSCGPTSETSDAKIVDIGWKTVKGFIPQILVCHDIQREHTFYSTHTIIGSNLDARSTDRQRPTFKEGGRRFYSKSSAAKIYQKSSQESQILTKYNIFDNSLERGHLAPDADFVYKEMQDATYYYFNVAPQWRNFNNGNWKFVENLVRRYAMRRKRNLRVHTGTFENLQLIGDDGTPSNIALGKDSNSNDLLPVPLYFWKVVFDEDSNHAIAFVVINHPKIEMDGDIPLKYDLCPSESATLCEDQSWKIRSRKSAKQGLLYCCSYQSLKKKIPWLPNGPGNDANVGLLSYNSNDKFFEDDFLE